MKIIITALIILGLVANSFAGDDFERDMEQHEINDKLDRINRKLDDQEFQQQMDKINRDSNNHPAHMDTSDLPKQRGVYDYNKDPGFSKATPEVYREIINRPVPPYVAPKKENPNDELLKKMELENHQRELERMTAQPIDGSSNGSHVDILTGIGFGSILGGSIVWLFWRKRA